MLSTDELFKNEVDMAKYLFNRQGYLCFQVNLYGADDNVIPIVFEHGDDEDTEAKRKYFAELKKTWLARVTPLVKQHKVRAISMISEIYLKSDKDDNSLRTGNYVVIGEGLQVNLWTKDTQRNWVAVVDKYSREIENENIGDEVVSRWDKDVKALLMEVK